MRREDAADDLDSLTKFLSWCKPDNEILAKWKFTPRDLRPRSGNLTYQDLQRAAGAPSTGNRQGQKPPSAGIRDSGAALRIDKNALAVP